MTGWIWFKKIIIRIFLVVAIIFVASWAYDAVSNSRYESRFLTDRQNTYAIVAFGDSLVEGLGSKQLVGFVGLLEQKIGMPIYNAGVRSNKTADLLARIDGDVLALDPKIVIVVIGGNDVVHGIPFEKTYANLEKLFFVLQSRGIVTLFGEVTDGVFFDTRNTELRALAEKYDVVYMPELLHGVFWTVDKKFDLLHPDDTGYQVIADRILPYLQDAMLQKNIAPYTP